jgi:hypothetical protein
MLDPDRYPDPHFINADPKPCFKQRLSLAKTKKLLTTKISTADCKRKMPVFEMQRIIASVLGGATAGSAPAAGGSMYPEYLRKSII